MQYNFYENSFRNGRYGHRRNLIIQIRKMISLIRVKPDFLIIGVQKAGTTSLYNYLIQHPRIISAFSKEVKYFDVFNHKSKSYYKAHFPTFIHKFISKSITGEATPDYIYFPQIAMEVHKFLPKAKIIVILRNPVDRAISQYKYSIKRGYENRKLSEAIESEKYLLSSIETYLPSVMGINPQFREQCYLYRGHYADQLRRWMAFFPKKQILVVETSELENTPQKVLDNVYNFLELPSFQNKVEKRYNESNVSVQIDDAIINTLRNYFFNKNEDLFQLIGESFDW